MESYSPVYNLSPTCNLSEDELDAVNSTNAEFAMWDPYKDKKRADEVEKQLEIYKKRALTSEAKVEELLKIIKLSRNELIKNNIVESLEKEDLKQSRWLECFSKIKDKINTNYNTEIRIISLEHSVQKIENKLDV